MFYQKKNIDCLSFLVFGYEQNLRWMNACLPEWVREEKKRNRFPSIQTTSTKRLGEVRLRYTNQYLEYLDFERGNKWNPSAISTPLEPLRFRWYPLKSRYYRCISEKNMVRMPEMPKNPNTFSLVLHFPIRVGFMVGATRQFQGFLDIKSAANPKAIYIYIVCNKTKLNMRSNQVQHTYTHSFVALCSNMMYMLLIC